MEEYVLLGDAAGRDQATNGVSAELDLRRAPRDA